MSDSPQEKMKISAEQFKKLMEMQQQYQAAGGKIPPQSPQKTFSINGFLNSMVKKMQKLQIHLDNFINYITKSEQDGRNSVLQSARAPIVFGTYVILIFVIVGGLWATLAPLNSAAIATGVVIPSTNRKVIQNVDPGVIKNIFVTQGQEVKSGDPLVELDDVKAKGDYSTTLYQYRITAATEARLVAERDKLKAIEFPEFLINDQDDEEVKKILDVQQKLFQYKVRLYVATKESVKQKLKQIDKQLESLEAKKIAVATTASIMTNRLKSANVLKAKGHMAAAAADDIKSKEASAKSEVMATESEIERTKQERIKTELEDTNIDNKYLTEVLSELKDNHIKKEDLHERLNHATNILDHVMIKSPVDGIVNVINIHTIGGVVGGGNTLLEISPANDNLIIEARVANKNIDAVKVGLIAKIRFSAFKSRTTPLFTGKVVSVSPDIVQENRGGQQQQSESSYVARIEIDMEEFNKLTKKNRLELHPGMQAEVQIITGKRTLLRYLLDPVTDTMFRAFNEK